MPLILQTATKENARQRAEVQIESYKDDCLLNSIMPDAPEEVKVKFFVEVMTREMDKPCVKNLEIRRLRNRVRN